MAVYLVRHAVAVGRSEWDGPDSQRPLTRKGERQALGLMELLMRDGVDVRRVTSSPAVRCRDSVSPLAEKLGVAVEDRLELAEGADAEAALGLLRELASAPGDAVACTHGDLIPEVLRRLSREGLQWDGELRFAKGSTWVLEVDGDRFTEGRYVEATD